MSEYPARYVGEFSHNDDFSKIASATAEIGSVAIVSGDASYGVKAWIRCACGDLDIIPVDGSRDAIHWQLVSREPIHLEPSILAVGWRRCHYFIRGGKLLWLEDSTPLEAGS